MRINRLVQSILCVTIASLACSFGAGCGKKATDETGDVAATAPEATGSTSASTLPEAKDVMAALDKKDYEAAIAGIVRAQQGVGSAEQQTQFTTLVDEVRIRLLDEAPSDPKANEALFALRRITGGR